MKKQTAVEFAVEKLEQFIPSGNQLVINIILEQAKEMEREQIIEAYLTPLSNEYWFQKDEILNQESEKYYNETYGGDKWVNKQQ